MNKRAKDELARSSRENGGGYDAQKDLHTRTGRDEKKGKTQEKIERGSRRDLQVLAERRWRDVFQIPTYCTIYLLDKTHVKIRTSNPLNFFLI